MRTHQNLDLDISDNEQETLVHHGVTESDDSHDALNLPPRSVIRKQKEEERKRRKGKRTEKKKKVKVEFPLVRLLLLLFFLLVVTVITYPFWVERLFSQ
ncbi:hypothetical protein [Alteribacter populi]|uniref:hypothetical protein n=1 Tax=Alteribacter populi TaxID=2011011 RepID=UPI000BBAF735|nr:hypothetical protein [Alteribacter populi]